MDNDGYVHYKVDFNENLSDDESNSWCDEAEIEESEEEEGEAEIEENYYDEEDSPVKRKKKKKKKKKKVDNETDEKTEVEEAKNETLEPVE